MRRNLIAAATTLVLLSGAAVAQSNPPTTTMPSAPNLSVAAVGPAVSADALIGKTVYGRDNNKIGEIDDVILDSNGQAKQLVIGAGGFLGMGEKKVAIDYAVGVWDRTQDRMNLTGLIREDFKTMPDFKYDDAMKSINRNKKPGETTTVK